MTKTTSAPAPADLEVHVTFGGTTYQLAAVRRDNGLTVFLRKEDGTLYTLPVTNDGFPTACTCKDYIWRKRRYHLSCKHMKNVRRLVRVLGGLGR